MEQRGREHRERDEKVFDLDERTFLFAKSVRAFVRRLPRTISNYEDVKQVVRSSCSVGANYIEANEGLGTKDFKMHAKICRKEAKESVYWLQLLFTNDNPSSRTTIQNLNPNGFASSQKLRNSN